MEKKAVYWGIAFVIFCGFLYLVQSVLLPFVAGLVLAYFLDPVVDRLEKFKIPRLIATVIVIGLFIFSFIAATFLLVPIIYDQISNFATKLPSYVQRLQSLITEENKAWLQTIAGDKIPDISKNVGEIVSKAITWLTVFLSGLLASGAAILSILSLMVVTPVVAFYLLYDWDRMIAAIDSWVPKHAQEDVRQIARDIDKALAGFIRGQALVCLILGLFYGIALTFVGLPYGFAIGLITGFISFIPYVGSLTGLLLSLGVAIVSFYPNWVPILIVAVIFMVGQIIEGNFLSPKFVGESVGLHPVWLMFSLFAFGALFGFTGLLIAVPVAAMIGVLIRFSLLKYLKSPLYKGDLT